MNQSHLRQALDEAIRESMEEYEVVQEQIKALEQRQAALDRVLGPALALFAQVTDERHELHESFQHLRELGRVRRAISEGRGTGRAGEVVRLPAGLGTMPSTSPREGLLFAAWDPPRVPETGRLREVFDVLLERRTPMRASEITEELQKRGLLGGVENPGPAVAAVLSRGVRLGLLSRLDRGLYAVSEEVRLR